MSDKQWDMTSQEMCKVLEQISDLEVYYDWNDDLIVCKLKGCCLLADDKVAYEDEKDAIEYSDYHVYDAICLLFNWLLEDGWSIKRMSDGVKFRFDVDNKKLIEVS